MPRTRKAYDFSSLCAYYESMDDTTPKYSTERQRFFLERASQLAMKSLMTQKHGCVIVNNNSIVSEGFNHYIIDMCHKYSIHAEVDALNKFKKSRYISDKTRLEMYVVRIGPKKYDHCLKYSKPCNFCQKAIIKHGINKVYYSTNTEFNEIWKKIHWE
jgi:deoxycytidylate deaminase